MSAKNRIVTPGEVVEFEIPSMCLMRIKWQVQINDDGSLSVFATGRRSGRIHVRPEGHTHVLVTTDRIIKELSHESI